GRRAARACSGRAASASGTRDDVRERAPASQGDSGPRRAGRPPGPPVTRFLAWTGAAAVVALALGIGVGAGQRLAGRPWQSRAAPAPVPAAVGSTADDMPR